MTAGGALLTGTRGGHAEGDKAARDAKAAAGAKTAAVDKAAASAPQFHDLSLTVASDLPCSWPAGMPQFQMIRYLEIGPLSAYNSEILVFDDHTGTQFDAPTHSVAPPDSKLPNAGPYGLMSSEKVPLAQFAGEACVLDCSTLVDSAPKGHGSLVKKDLVMAWERENRPLVTGDVVLLHSGYSDRYYKAFPDGRRFIADPVEGTVPGWPDPDPDCMEYFASRKVMALATDSPSMGPLPPPLGEETHYAGLKHGMIWTEAATGLGALPRTGAFYCVLATNVVGSVGASARALAIVGDPLARQLIEAARAQKVVDLSLPLLEDRPVWWPGRGVGNSRHPYFKYLMPPYQQARHTLDSHCGTHLVPPAYALPPTGFDNQSYSTEVRGWLTEYEKRYGPRGTSNVTAEQVPVSQTCGRARLFDVKHLAGTTSKKSWPTSPEITLSQIREFEDRHGVLEPGDIMLFHTGHSERHFQPFPAGKSCMEDPLNGQGEGWPVPGPEAILYLAGKGVRCVGTDGPNLGGTEPKRALMTYWALGSRGMVGVEYLTNLSKLPEKAYFLFAAMKIRGCHGGPGRALALGL